MPLTFIGSILVLQKEPVRLVACGQCQTLVLTASGKLHLAGSGGALDTPQQSFSDFTSYVSIRRSRSTNSISHDDSQSTRVFDVASRIPKVVQVIGYIQKRLHVLT